MSEHHLHARLVSSLEKGLVTESVESYPALERISVLKGERLSFQLFLRIDHMDSRWSRLFTVEAEGIDATAREVRQIYADLPCDYEDNSREQGLFLESESGLYPDVLEPLDAGNRLRPKEQTLTAVWFETTLAEAGEYPVTVTVKENGETVAALPLTVTVIDATLPEQSLIYTQWFHCDCLASYYNVPVLSEDHWRIMENYMACAVRHGVNCILTPILTPPLDTEIGGERPTVQLVGVTKDGDRYCFDFSLLKRYLDMARACGIRYFEISHLFTQWGAAYAPKVVAVVDGTERSIFGWHTPGTEGEYPNFLTQLLPELVAFLRSEDVLENCRFHVSDEPREEHLEQYRKAKAIVEPYLKDCVIVDALSSIDFYRKGVVQIPIPASNHVEPFLEEDIRERWTYYCCGQWNKVANRFVAYPAFRNRIIGVQLYKYRMDGFLHWGYNFYYSKNSRRLINPYLTQSCDGQVQSGDPFSVYPGPMGQPLASTRLSVFYEAIQDMEALKLCESLVGREKVVALIDGLAGAPVTFSSYPKSAEYLIELRERVNSLITQALG